MISTPETLYGAWSLGWKEAVAHYFADSLPRCPFPLGPMTDAWADGFRTAYNLLRRGFIAIR